MDDTVQSFRTSFRGFNRDDVVQFLETAATQHANAISALEDENQRLRQELEANELRAQAAQARLIVAQRELEKLKAQLAQAEAAPSVPAEEPAPLPEAPQAPANPDYSARELEAYRRAEKTERMAKNRANKLYDQVNGMLLSLAQQMNQAQSATSDATGQLLAALEALRSQITENQNLLAQSAASLQGMQISDPE